MSYTPPTYSEGGANKRLRDLPRGMGKTGFPGWKATDAQMEEWVLSFLALIFGCAALGVILFFFLPYWWCCRKKERMANKRARLVFIFCVGMTMIGAIVGFTGNNSMSDAMKAFGDGTSGLADIFKDVSTQVSPTNGQKSIDDTITGITEANTACSGESGYTSAIQATRDSATDALKKSKTAMQDLVTSLKDPEKSLRDLKGKVDEYEDLRSQATLGALAICCGVFVFGLLHIFYVWRGTSVKAFQCLVMFLGIIVMLVAMILAGLNLGIGALIADVCVDPAFTFSSISDDVATKKEMEYLFYCKVKPDSQTSLEEAVKAADDGKKFTDDYFKAIEDSVPNCKIKPAFTAAKTKSTGGSAGFAKSIDGIRTALSCEKLNKPIVRIVYDGLCTDLTAGSEALGAGFFLIGIFGFIALCCIGGVDEEEEEENELDGDVDGDDKDTEMDKQERE